MRGRDYQAEGKGAKQISVFEPTSSDWPKPGEPTRAKEQQQEGGAKQIGILDNRESDWPKNGNHAQQQQEGAKAAEAGHN